MSLQVAHTLDGRDDDPRLEGQSSSGPRPSQMNDLPGAVVIRVLQFSGRQETVALACLSKRLNRITTSYVLTKSKLVLQPTQANILRSSDSAEDPLSLVPHILAISFWVRSIKSVTYSLGFPLTTTIQTIGHLAGFISRLSTVEKIHLNFHPVDYDLMLKKDVGPAIYIDKWETAIVNLMQAARMKGVQDLCITNGRALPPLLYGFKHHPGQALPLRPLVKSRNLLTKPTLSDQIALSSPIPAPPKPIPSAEVIPTRQKKKEKEAEKGIPARPAGFIAGVLDMFYRRNRSAEPSLPATLQAFDSPNKPQRSFVPSKDESTQDGKVNPQSSEHSFIDSQPPETPISTTTRQAPDLSSLPVRPTSLSNPSAEESMQDGASGPAGVHGPSILRLDCPIFFLPPLTSWSLNFIMQSPSSITALSLKDHTHDTSSWKRILNAIRLPNLETFAISSTLYVDKEGAATQDLIDFFSRHQTITDLAMHGMQLAPFLPTHVPNTPLLPNLTRLAAHPFYIAMIVNGHNHAIRNPLTSFRSGLNFIKFVAEQYGPWYSERSVPGTKPEDLMQGLEAISNYPQPLELSLGISSADNDVFEAWIKLCSENSRQFGPIVRQLRSVRTLTLDFIYRTMFSDPELTKTVLPPFFNLFPGLEVVNFVHYGSSCLDADEVKKIWVAKCPKVGRFEVGSFLTKRPPIPVAALTEPPAEERGLVSDQIAA